MAKAATDEPSRIDILEKEVGTMRKREALHRKYGTNLNDVQIAYYEQVEAREAAMKEKHARTPALLKQERDRIEALRKERALELVNDGKIALYVNKERVQPVGPNLAVLCPHCGKPLAEATGELFAMAARVVDATIPGVPDTLYEIAAQGTSRYVPCPACRAAAHLLVQIRP